MDGRLKNTGSHSAKPRDMLQRELERAIAAKSRLEEEHTNLLRKVARSPRKLPRASPSKPQAPAGQSSVNGPPAENIQAHRPLLEKSVNENQGTPLLHVGQSAGKPSSPPDTHGQEMHEVDAAISKSIRHVKSLSLHEICIGEDTFQHHLASVNVSRTNDRPEENGKEISTLSLNSGLVDQSTPYFMTAKRRNLHCELDTPGANVFFSDDCKQAPRHKGRSGFFARLLSCFLPPSTVYSSTQTRPGSGNSVNAVTPPHLTLKGEMAPLHQNLASLNQDYAQRCAEVEQGAQENRQEQEHDVLVMGKEGETPSRQAPISATEGHTGGLVQDHLQDSLSEASHLSLEVETSALGHDVMEDETPVEGKSQRRTPMAGSGGIPRLRGRRSSSQDNITKKKQPRSTKKAKAKEGKRGGSIIQPWLADIPLPPQEPPLVPQPVAKQTNVSLNTLMNSPQRVKNRNATNTIAAYTKSAPPSPGRVLVDDPLGAAACSAPASRASSPVRTAMNQKVQSQQRPQPYPRTTLATEKRRAATQRLLAARRQREEEELAAWSRQNGKKPRVAGKSSHDQEQIGRGEENRTKEQKREGMRGKDQLESPGFHDMLERLTLGLSVDASRVRRAKRPRAIDGQGIGQGQGNGGVANADAGADVNRMSKKGLAFASSNQKKSDEAKELVGKIKDLERSLTLEDLEALRAKLAA